mmetsp:Transcript_12004/g.28091  ORF Transcript_12004/g.28091 Transcript_12004/m.28091 type:complete len:104 (+) Transcript_12004:207-518(+)
MCILRKPRVQCAWIFFRFRVAQEQHSSCAPRAQMHEYLHNDFNMKQWMVAHVLRQCELHAALLLQTWGGARLPGCRCGPPRKLFFAMFAARALKVSDLLGHAA